MPIRAEQRTWRTGVALEMCSDRPAQKQTNARLGKDRWWEAHLSPLLKNCQQLDTNDLRPIKNDFEGGQSANHHDGNPADKNNGIPTYIKSREHNNTLFTGKEKMWCLKSSKTRKHNLRQLFLQLNVIVYTIMKAVLCKMMFCCPLVVDC